MNQPYPGGFGPQQGRPMQPGVQQPGPYGPPGYAASPAGPRKPSRAMAYVTAIVLLPVITILSFAMGSTDYSPGEFATHMWVTMTGLALLNIYDETVDASIIATLVYVSILVLSAVLLFARVGFARWVAAGFGFLGFAYYVFAPIRFTMIGFAVVEDGRTVETELPGEFVVFPWIVAFLLLIASIMAVLPVTGRAMRGYKPKQPMGPSGYVPPGYPPPGHGAPPGHGPPGHGPPGYGQQGYGQQGPPPGYGGGY